MVRKILFAFALSVSLSSVAQDRGKITSALSFAPGFLTENTYTIQVQGYLGYLKDRIELRGDGFYFIDSYGDRPRFSMNHQLFAGAMYHFSDNAFQPYAGFQPGIAFAKSSEYGTLNSTSGEIDYNMAVSPIGSATVGFSFYGEKLFFLFMEGRYIFGKHKANTYSIFLDEARISFGLGLYL